MQKVSPCLWFDGQEFTALEGGQPSQCGWLTDRFGVSWQTVLQQAADAA